MTSRFLRGFFDECLGYIGILTTYNSKYSKRSLRELQVTPEKWLSYVLVVTESLFFAPDP
jgi:hypothetical protein